MIEVLLSGLNGFNEDKGNYRPDSTGFSVASAHQKPLMKIDAIIPAKLKIIQNMVIPIPVQSSFMDLLLSLSLTIDRKSVV